MTSLMPQGILTRTLFDVLNQPFNSATKNILQTRNHETSHKQEDPNEPIRTSFKKGKGTKKIIIRLNEK